MESILLIKCGFKNGSFIYKKICFFESLKHFDIKRYLFWDCLIPAVTEVVIIGKDINNAEITGTIFELNQNIVTKMMAITGVVRIKESGISKKSRANSNVPHKIPNRVPAKIEIIKAIITLKKVCKKASQNFFVEIIFIKENKTVFGPGKIKVELITEAAKIQMRKIEIIERE